MPFEILGCIRSMLWPFFRNWGLRAPEPPCPPPLDSPCEPELPTRPHTSQNTDDITKSLEWLKDRYYNVMSSPFKTTIDRTIEGSQYVSAETSTVQWLQSTLKIFQESVLQDRQRRVTRRRRVAKFGPFIGTDAIQKIREVALLSPLLFVILTC